MIRQAVRRLLRWGPLARWRARRAQYQRRQRLLRALDAIYADWDAALRRPYGDD